MADNITFYPLDGGENNKFETGNRVKLPDGRIGTVSSWPFRVGCNAGLYPVWCEMESLFFSEEELELAE